jgi:dTDP-4-dehydrorhamnose reductase
VNPVAGIEPMTPNPMRILLTGASGQVGGDLFRLLQGKGTVIAPTRLELDLSNPVAIREYVRKVRPDWIINPAAYTAVDKAESEPALAYAINAEAPRALGIEAARLGVPVIHFSTDYVFDGTGDRPWVEDDPTSPLGVYGASKLTGEQAILDSGAAHLVFRTSWVYSSTGRNFLLTILRLAQQKEELRIVDDQHGAPTWSRDLAQMVVHVIDWISREAAASGKAPEELVRAVPRIYHATGTGDTTWFGFASEFVRLAATARPEMRFARLVPISSSEYPTPARRPSNSRLNCERLRKVFGFSMQRWQDATAAVVAEVLARG